jgi:hypothetical protein
MGGGGHGPALRLVRNFSAYLARQIP